MDDDDDDNGDGNDDDDNGDGDDDGLLRVEPRGSRSAYRDMVDFVGSRTDEGMLQQLEWALEGRGAFRRFKDVVLDEPEDRNE